MTLPYFRMRVNHPPEIAPAIGSDPQGNVLVAINAATADFGAGHVEATARNYGTVLKLDRDCNTSWSRSFPEMGALLWLDSVVSDSKSNIIVTGVASASGGMGDLLHPDLRVFVTKLDADGNPLWSRLLGAGSFEVNAEARVDARDNLIVSGVDESGTEIEGVTICRERWVRDQVQTEMLRDGTRNGRAFSLCGYALGLDPDGNPLWVASDLSTRPFATPSPDGAVLAKAPDQAAGERWYLIGGVITKLDARGERLWNLDLAQRLGNSIRTPYDRDRLLAVDGEGAVLQLAPDVVPEADDASVMPLPAAIAFGPFPSNLSKVDASGAPLWSMPASDAIATRAGALAVDSNGHVLLAGDFLGSVAFGSTTLESRGQRDVFVTELSAAGAPLWSAAVGADGDDFVSALATGPQAPIWVAGWTGSSAWNDGGRGYDSLQRNEVFITQLAP